VPALALPVFSSLEVFVVHFSHRRFWPALALLVAALALGGCGKTAVTQPESKNPLPPPGPNQTPGPTPPSPKPGPAPQPEPKPKSDIETRLAAKPDVVLKEDELIAELKKDFTLKQYDGKIVDVTGVVKGFHFFGTQGQPALRLGSRDVSYICKQPEALALAAPGQTVTLRLGQSTLAGPIDCLIVKTEGPAPPELTADQLAKELDADKDGTTKKYKGKHILVKGKWQASKEEPFVRVVLSSPNVKPEITCDLVREAADAGKKNGWVKAGEEVRILAEFTGTAESTLTHGAVLPPAK
jgi:hypothetical protein